MIGTDNGIYVTDRWPKEKSSKPKRVLEASQVTQIEVLEEYKLLIVLANKTLTSYSMEALEPTDSQNPLVKRPKKIQGHVNFFKAGIGLGRHLVASVKTSALSTTIKVFEPMDNLTSQGRKPALSRMFQSNQDALKPFKVSQWKLTPLNLLAPAHPELPPSRFPRRPLSFPSISHQAPFSSVITALEDSVSSGVPNTTAVLEDSMSSGAPQSACTTDNSPGPPNYPVLPKDPLALELTKIKEFYIPAESSSVHFLRSTLCVGCSRGFEVVSLETTETQSLLDQADTSLDFVQRKETIRPIHIERLNGEFLLNYSDFSFFVDRNGWRARPDWKITWEGTPTDFALSYPYILAFETSFLEIRHVETAELIHIMTGKNIRMLHASTREVSTCGS